MAIWGIRYHFESSKELWIEPKPSVKLLAFAASPRGAFVVVESEHKPCEEADFFSPSLEQIRDIHEFIGIKTGALKEKVFFYPVETEYHKRGCKCKNCNWLGKAYGIGTFSAKAAMQDSSKKFSELTPLSVAFGPSIGTAKATARSLAAQMGYEVVNVPLFR